MSYFQHNISCLIMKKAHWRQESIHLFIHRYTVKIHISSTRMVTVTREKNSIISLRRSFFWIFMTFPVHRARFPEKLIIRKDLSVDVVLIVRGPTDKSSSGTEDKAPAPKTSDFRGFKIFYRPGGEWNAFGKHIEVFQEFILILRGWNIHMNQLP